MKKLKLAAVVHPEDLNWESDWVTWEDPKDAPFFGEDVSSVSGYGHSKSYLKIGVGDHSNQVYTILPINKLLGYKVVVFNSDGSYFGDLGSSTHDLYVLRDRCDERERGIAEEGE